MLDDPIDVLDEDVVPGDDHLLLLLLLLRGLSVPLALLRSGVGLPHLKLSGLLKDWSLLLGFLRARVEVACGLGDSSGGLVYS